MEISPPLGIRLWRLRKLLWLILILPSLAQAGGLSGRVVEIPQANRILILTDDGRRHLIALAGLALPDHPDHRWKRSAKRQLQMLVAGRQVSVDILSWQRRGVILGIVRHGGADIGLRILGSGLAVLDKPASVPSEIKPAYQKAQEEARRRGLGYWQSIR